ncbi:MAG: FAD-dependent oxidoreductase [Bacteroidales bacterium]|nr:FAD-dependent oxidoreductase [Candidatus Cryptobacteroides aphodequi]
MLAISLLAASIFLEAEFFQNPGGWTVESQFYDQVGSQYLLAQGNGVPVEDATTCVKFPSSGTYHAYVRTYNWNAPWDADTAPGTFLLKVNESVIGNVLGTAPDKWGWHYAGSFRAERGEAEVALHDLTGFCGRCDAICFTKRVPANAEPSRPKAKKSHCGRYDFVVVGGGAAGISAAVSAARLGQKTLLLQDRPVLGGNNSPEIGVTITGGVKLEPYDHLGTVIDELGSLWLSYERADSIIRSETNLDVLTGRRVIAATTRRGRIRKITAVNLADGSLEIYSSKLFADCTGDGNLGYLAGADFTCGRESSDVYGENLAPEYSEPLSYGSTLKWKAAALDSVSSFPKTPWAVQFNSATAQRATGSQWFWEAGMNKDQIADAEYIRDYWYRVIYGNWSYLKNSPETRNAYANYGLNQVSNILGKRESRRLLGDYVICQNDVEGLIPQQEDAFVICTYSIDQHFPRPDNSADFPGNEFLVIQKHNHNEFGPVDPKIPGENINQPFFIPYRCLYSRNIDNLFMAGRDISASRIAMCALRVQGTTAMMGELVGIAASCCNKYGYSPRELYEEGLDTLKNAVTCGIPVKNESRLTINLR